MSRMSLLFKVNEQLLIVERIVRDEDKELAKDIERLKAKNKSLESDISLQLDHLHQLLSQLQIKVEQIDAKAVELNRKQEVTQSEVKVIDERVQEMQEVIKDIQHQHTNIGASNPEEVGFFFIIYDIT